MQTEKSEGRIASPPVVNVDRLLDAVEMVRRENERRAEEYRWPDGRHYTFDGQPVPPPVEGEEQTPGQQAVRAHVLLRERREATAWAASRAAAHLQEEMAVEIAERHQKRVLRHRSLKRRMSGKLTKAQVRLFVGVEEIVKQGKRALVRRKDVAELPGGEATFVELCRANGWHAEGDPERQCFVVEPMPLAPVAEQKEG